MEKADLQPEPSDNPPALPVSTRTIVEAGGLTRRSLNVFCPMDRCTVELNRCVECPNCAAFDSEGSEDRRPVVLCLHESPPVSPPLRPVGGLLARHSVCVRVRALAEALVALPMSGGALAVVDGQTRLVGVVRPRRERLVDVPPRLVLPESMSIADARVRMAECGAWQAPVTANDGTFVGTVENLALERALTVRGSLT